MTNVSDDAERGATPTDETDADIIVDTIYDWPREIVPVVAANHRDAAFFNSFEARKWADKRRNQGWRVVETIQVPGSPNPDPSVRNVFTDFSRTLIVYRKG